MAIPACCLANDNQETAHFQRDLRHVSVPALRSLSNSGLLLVNLHPVGTGSAAIR
jgi:hypothetical protein